MKNIAFLISILIMFIGPKFVPYQYSYLQENFDKIEQEYMLELNEIEGLSAFEKIERTIILEQEQMKLKMALYDKLEQNQLTIYAYMIFALFLLKFSLE